ncbi:MAG: hypothetical protein H0V83_02770 [Rubrobacter sp.]|nr:hypothetical protein [Rubrobacter sp.]
MGAQDFYTLLGRPAQSLEFQDLRALHGPETERHNEAVPPERWERFLNSDERAAEILEELKETAAGNVYSLLFF